MKKLLVCALLLALTLTATFAEKTKIHGIGISVPIQVQYLWNDDALLDETVSTVGINLNYKNMSAHGDGFAGFSAIFELQAGYAGGSSDMSDLIGVDIANIKWGWGVAFRPTDKIILAAHGILGADVRALLDINFATRIGTDVVFIYRFTDKFGISAQIDTYVPIIGFGQDHHKVWKEKNRYDSTLVWDDKHENFMIYGGIGCDLKFGVCWVY